jgi:ribosomal protein S18 acetylase RimI-like enzyme
MGGIAMTKGHLTYGLLDLDRDLEIQGLFDEYSFKDYQIQFMGAPKRQMVEYFKKSLFHADVLNFCLRDKNQLIGLISIKALPWLSKHFGFRMYGVVHLLTKGEDPLVQARLLRYVMEESRDVDFLDCRIAANDVHSAHALEICGFRYVGAEIYLGRILQTEKVLAPSILFEISPFLGDRDKDQILDIAGKIHIHNRFSYDPFIKEEAAKSVYQRLVANCFEDDQFNILVARSPEKIEGFIISKFNRTLSDHLGFRCASLDFIGVRREIRNKGLGQALNQWALADLARNGVVFVGVRTMASNYRALTVCHRTGFQMTSSSLHFHKWVSRPRVSPSITLNVLPSFESISSKTLFNRMDYASSSL